jgi:hypothetical protein
MATSQKHLLLRSLSVLLLAGLAFGCHVTVHNYGGKAPKGGGKDGGGETTAGAKDGKPKGDKSKGDKPDKTKGDKPDKTKGDKPDKSKGDKPKGDKPKGDKPPKTDQPSTSKPGVDQPSEPPPPPGISRMTVPVRAPFEELVERVDALLPKTQSQDYQRMGKEGENAVLDVKYTVWRDPIEAKFKGRTLTVVVPVRYAANIRGKVKNPFGSDYLPLNEGQTWGTKSSPQRMRITMSLDLDVNDEWKLESEAKVEKIEHGAPPKGNFCAHAGIDFCTPKENLAGEVRKNIERYLTPKITKELARAEGELQKKLDLRTQANALWAAVQKPLRLQKVGEKSCPTTLLASCDEEAWLVFEPTSFGLSELSVVEGDLGVDIGLEGKLRVATGKKPKTGTEKLPKPAKLPGSTAFQLSATLDVPLSALAKEIRAVLSEKHLESDKKRLEIRDVEVEMTGKGELRLSIETKGLYAGKLGMVGKLVLDEKKNELRLEQVAFDATTKELFGKELKGIDQQAVVERVEKAGRITLDKESKALRRAITHALDGALPGRLEVKGALDDLAVRSVGFEGDRVELTIEVRGSLSLEYSL